MQTFWQKNPALFFSLPILITIIFFLKSPWALLFLLLLLWKAPLKKAFFIFTLFLLTLFWIQHTLYFPTHKSICNLTFRIQSIENSTKRFQKGVLYRGKIQAISDDQRIFHKTNLSASIYGKRGIDLNCDYLIKGTLYNKGGFHYFIHSKEEWIPTKTRFTLLPIRTETKKAYVTYIKKQYKEPIVANFLIALTCGEIEDLLLKAHLTQIGCAHLLAISGFHFALIATFCNILLQPFFHFKIHRILVIFLLTLYLIFIGGNASILRAFIFATCFLLGAVFERRSSAINTLGIAMGICLLIDPLMAVEVGFQLSFLATATLLLFYAPLEKILTFKNDHFMGKFLGKAFALNLPIHIVLFPFLLLYFHTASVHSIIYNLFFPTLTAGSLMLFLSGSLIHLIVPPLAKAIHFINGHFTSMFLSIGENRMLYEKQFYVESLPDIVIVLLFLGLYFLIRALHTKNIS